MYCGVVGGCKMGQPLWNTVEVPQKKSYIDMIQQPCFWGFLPEGSESKNNG